MKISYTLLVVVMLFLTIIFLLNYQESFFTYKNNMKELMPIYCINMKKHSTRWNKISKQAKSEKLEITRFEAINGFSYSMDSLIKKNIISPFTPFTRGTAGCYMSHHKLWTKIAKNNDNYALIIEDDVIFEKDFLNKLLKLLVNIPQDWDIIYLGLTRPYGSHVKENIYKTNYKVNTNAGAYAYILKKSTAKTLIKLCSFPMKEMIDHCIKKHHSKFNVYFTYPYLIKHDFNVKPVRLKNKIYSADYIKNTNKLSLHKLPAAFDQPRARLNFITQVIY